MSKQIQAKPTRFAGVQFKSRLEAKWAVLLQRAGRRWTYEPTTWRAPNGWSYTPDFRIEQEGTPLYLEVKPTCPTWDYIKQLRGINEEGPPLVVAIGSFFESEPILVLPEHFTKKGVEKEDPRLFRGWLRLADFLEQLGCPTPWEAIKDAKTYRFDLR